MNKYNKRYLVNANFSASFQEIVDVSPTTRHRQFGLQRTRDLLNIVRVTNLMTRKIIYFSQTHNCWRWYVNTADWTWPHVIREMTQNNSVRKCGCEIFRQCHFQSHFDMLNTKVDFSLLNCINITEHIRNKRSYFSC